MWQHKIRAHQSTLEPCERLKGQQQPTTKTFKRSTIANDEPGLLAEQNNITGFLPIKYYSGNNTLYVAIM